MPQSFATNTDRHTLYMNFTNTDRHSQSVFEHVVKLAQGRLIATAVAVVRSAEHGHNTLLMAPVETLHKITAFHINITGSRRLEFKFSYNMTLALDGPKQPLR